VTAAILAGGLGTRLRSVVADRPKVLAEVRGRPFLSFLLDQLAAAGVRYVVLCTGYRGEQVQAAFGNSYGGLRLAYSQEPSPLGTAGALRWALPLCESDVVLALNGDSFCDADLPAFWDWRCARGAEATLLLTRTPFVVRHESAVPFVVRHESAVPFVVRHESAVPFVVRHESAVPFVVRHESAVPDAARYGRVRLGADGRVLSFDEKDGRSGQGWINAGIYLLHRRLLSTIPATGTVSLEREVFPAWVDRGLYGYPSQGRFLDVGTPASYAAAERFFAEEQR
jgi:NDP-sugar pyrophosphorylase family protein